MLRMKVAELAFSLSSRAGGIFEIQLGQSHALASLGVDVEALGLEDDLWSQDKGRWGSIRAHVFPVQGPSFFGFSRGFANVLADFAPDLCHLHTLWMYPGVAMQRWSRKNVRPYIVTPNGMLEPWALANSGWKKRLAGFFYENSMLRGAACLQANTLKEADDFRAFGLKNRIEIVPNGVDLPDKLTTEDTESTEGKKRLLFLGRIHPKKGLAGALRSWADIQNSKFKIQNAKQWQFVIAGWDQGGHEWELKALCDELGLKIAMGLSHGVSGSTKGQNLKLNSYNLKTSSPEAEAADVVFYGPAFGQEKEDLFRGSEAFILPSVSEGLPMSVLEAWSYSLPVVMTPECNLPEGFASGAALEIRNSEMGNAKWDALRELIEMTEADRRVSGMRGRRLVEERFTWPKVAKSLKEIYESLLR